MISIDLPCNAGDTVWVITAMADIDECKVHNVLITRQKIMFQCSCGKFNRNYSIKSFGTKIFTTREEAKKVLEERIRIALAREQKIEQCV